jgi:hypothetical protein
MKNIQPKSVPVLVTNQATGFSKKYHSMGAAARDLGVSPKQVVQACKRQNLCHGHSIERQVPSISESSVALAILNSKSTNNQ